MDPHSPHVGRASFVSSVRLPTWLRCASWKAGDTMKVLLVGVAAGSQAIVARVLTAQGHEPLVSADGARGLEALQKDLPALVVVEGLLPDMTAADFCRRARANACGADVVILVITDGDNDLAAVLDAGATDLYTTSLGSA